MAENPNPSSPRTPSRIKAMLLSLPFIGTGGCVMTLSLGLIPSKMQSFKAPPIILAITGAVFVFVGLFVLLQGSFESGGQQTALYKWLELFILGGLLLTFAATFLWIGFDPGGYIFSSSTSADPLTVSGEGNLLAGRLVFGLFGLGTLIGAIAFIYQKIMTLPFGDDEPSE